MIDYSKYKLALHHLKAQYENYRTLPEELPTLMKEGIAESVIQRFETCYDCMWKLLARYIREELGVPEVPASPKPIFRLANETLLLPSPAEQWMKYAEARIGTSHDYSGEKARICLELTEAFIADAIQLYQKMSGCQWTD